MFAYTIALHVDNGRFVGTDLAVGYLSIFPPIKSSRPGHTLKQLSRDRDQRLYRENEKKGHWSSAPLFQDGRRRGSFVKSIQLTQCRSQNHILRLVVLCNFGLVVALRQFVTRFISLPPDLRQEIPSSVSMEDKLGLCRTIQ
jgi:hypothetical protein